MTATGPTSIRRSATWRCGARSCGAGDEPALSPRPRMAARCDLRHMDRRAHPGRDRCGAPRLDCLARASWSSAMTRTLMPPMKPPPLTDEQVDDLRRRWNATFVGVPRPPRAGLALTVFAAINRVKHG